MISTILLSILVIIALFVLVLAILYNNRYHIFLNWFVNEGEAIKTRSKLSFNRRYKAFYIAFNEQRYNSHKYMFCLYINMYFFGCVYSTEVHK